jgi:hypothetical protein
VLTDIVKHPRDHSGASGPPLVAAYEKRSLILTSNLHPARFDTIFPKGLATAAVDRLLHHAHVIVTEGQSHRISEAMEGRGVAKLQAAET